MTQDSKKKEDIYIIPETCFSTVSLQNDFGKICITTHVKQLYAIVKDG